MSLNFNYSKCSNTDELHNNPFDENTINPVTEAVIFNMMSIDMGVITAENVEEVWFRTVLHSLTTDACAIVYRNPGEEPVRVYLTRDDIVRHIGLTTNVTTKTRRQWLARCYDDKHSINWLNTDRIQKKPAMQMLAEQAAKVKAAKEAENPFDAAEILPE
jgi:hypothetical protein